MSRTNPTSEKRKEIDIVKYVADFRQAVNQQSISSAASNTKAAQQTIDHDGALDFFLEASNFLKNEGHEVKFYEMPPPVKPNACGGYVPVDRSIELPVTRDSNNNFIFDLTNPVRLDTALTLAHEVTHAVDHYLRIEEEKTLGSQHWDKGLYSDSYSALHASRQFDDDVGSQRKWEEESASVFDIDLSKKSHKRYRGVLSTEVLPRLVEHQFNGVNTAERIAGLSEDSQIATNGIIDAFANRLDEVSKGLEQDSHDTSFPKSFSARLRSVTNQGVAVAEVDHNPPEEVLVVAPNRPIITPLPHCNALTDSLDALLEERSKAVGGNNITLDDAVDDAVDTINNIDRARDLIINHSKGSADTDHRIPVLTHSKESAGSYRN